MKDSKILANNDNEMANSNQISTNASNDTSLESHTTKQNNIETNDYSPSDVYDYRKKTQTITTQNKDKKDYINTIEYDNDINEIPQDIIATDSIKSNEIIKNEVNNNLKEDLQTSNSSVKQQEDDNKQESQTTKDSINKATKQDDKEIPITDTITQKKSKKQRKRKKAKQQKYKWKYIIYSKRILAGIILVSFIVSGYALYLMFGSTSFEVLYKLHQTRNMLRLDVEQSKIDNAELQRKVLELKSLEPK